MNVKKIFILTVSITALALLAAVSGQIVETNNAGSVQVKQAAVSGNLSCKLEPGMYFQNFGDIHTYKEASTFHFSTDSERGDGSLPTRFSDATKAKVSGNVRVLLPVTNCEQMIKIHRKFRSFDNVMRNLVEPAMRKALFHSGPHMTADESYATRRGEFAALAEDQLIHGVIRTDKKVTTRVNPLTDIKQEVEVVTARVCEKDNGTTCVNGFERDLGVFSEFGIGLTNFVIDGITYPDAVLKQIETQRAARMNIITKEAEAKEADARARKADAEAKAQVAETRAAEEVAKTQLIVRAEASKAEAVLAAEKVRDVAKLEKEAAEFEKRKQILLGEGEATRKRLVMQADGALQQKLEALVEINAKYADALSKAQPGALVPSLQMGTSGNSSATNFIDLLSVAAAKQLSVDTKVR